MFPLSRGTVGQTLVLTDNAGTLDWGAGGGGGGGGWTVVTTAASTYTTANGTFLLVNAGASTVTLPPAVLNHRVAVKWIAAPASATSTVEIRTASAGVTIDGVVANAIGYKIWNRWDTVTMISDGTSWFIEA
jgi:hypothetical protein